ncbi:MAG: hypothetical protein HYX57_10970 [Chloroflexi bacterium]|nr:hypothetical protein [Chloroflexota bacterium]
MSDIKRTARDVEDQAKATWRKADGDESVGDKLANAGDRIRHGAENLGDKAHEKADQASREMDYQRGRADGAVEGETHR